MSLAKRMCFGLCVVALATCKPTFANDDATKPAQPSTQRDGQHDFDFEIGMWKTNVKRRLHPLTGSTAWTEYDGTSVVRKILDSRAKGSVDINLGGPRCH